jgi:hypothetical protein
MFPEKLLEVLKRAGVVAIATQGQDGPHLVNTWNSYVQINQEGRLLIPAGYMWETEANVAANSRVLLTAGSHEVAGKVPEPDSLSKGPRPSSPPARISTPSRQNMPGRGPRWQSAPHR